MRTNQRRPLAAFALTSIGLGLMCACAVYPPGQLVAIRLSYADLSNGPAARLAPGELADAKKSVDLADREFSAHGDTSLCRDYSYIAQNKLDLAAAAAEAEEERRALATMNTDTAGVTPLHFDGGLSGSPQPPDI